MVTLIVLLRRGACARRMLDTLASRAVLASRALRSATTLGVLELTLLPQAPQWRLSLAVLMHPPSHITWPGPHPLPTHLPPSQLVPGGHCQSAPQKCTTDLVEAIATIVVVIPRVVAYIAAA